MVGLEITQGVGEREPIAIGYLGDATGRSLDESASGLDSFDDVLGSRR